MLLALYSIGIRIYYWLAILISPFNTKASYWIEGRRNQFEVFKNAIEKWKTCDRVWIHAASYGEFEMSWPLINSLIEKNEKLKFIISFYSPSGYNRIELDSERFLKIYLPVDLRSNLKKYIELAQPSSFIFIKYEFWFNLMKELMHFNVPYYFIGLHLEKDSYLMKSFFKPFLELIKNATRVYTHSENSIDILKNKGFKNLKLLGDLRIAQVLENKEKTIDLEWKDSSKKTLIYGSVTGKELPFIIDTIDSMPECNHILALHDVEDKYIKAISKRNWNESYISRTTVVDSNVLIVDSYGQLKYLYNSTDLAYIGGGFEKGPHNVLEAMIYDVPVMIGPNVKKFPLAKRCISQSIIFKLNSLEDLKTKLTEEVNKDHSEIINKSKAYILNNRPRINELVEELKQNFVHV